MRCFLLLLLGLAPACSPAAGASEGFGNPLIELGMREGRAMSLLESLVEAAPKRLSGSDGYEAAVEWGLRTMRQIGLSKVRRHEVFVPVWVRGEKEQAWANLAGGERLELSACALGGTPATPADGLTAEVVELAGLEELSEAKDRLAGKIVFFNGVMDPESKDTFGEYSRVGQQRFSGPALASKVGAAAVIIRSLSTRRDDAPHTGQTNFRDSAPIPALALGVSSAEKLSAAIASGKVQSLTLRTSCQQLEDRASANVIGEIPGSEWPEQIVLVGGHLDAWDLGQGAHDDGAGCVHALEAARLLLAAGVKPKRTIRVVLFANEENGLRGGEAYAEDHAGEKHFIAIESDRGGFAPRGLGFDLSEAARKRLEPLAAPLAELGAAGVFGGGGGADIGPLHRRGVPVAELLPEAAHYFDVHHSSNDNLKEVDAEELQKGATVLAFWLSLLADLEPATLKAE